MSASNLTPTALTVAECAAALNLTPKQVRYAVSQGAPIVQRGAKGRGHSMLLDPARVSEWLKTRGTFITDHHLQLARDLTASVASAAVEQFRAQSGPHKRELAVNIVWQFQMTADAIREQLGLPPIEPEEIPEGIRKIAQVVSILR